MQHKLLNICISQHFIYLLDYHEEKQHIQYEKTLFAQSPGHRISVLPRN